MHPLKNILNRILWSKTVNPQEYEVTYVHRGGVGDQASVRASVIRRVGSSWFSFGEDSEETLIPFHRILLVRNLRTGEVLWRGRRPSSDG